MRKSAFTGIFIAVIAYAWAAILIRWSQEAPPLTIAFYRMVVASIVWTPIFFLWKPKGQKKPKPITKRQLKWMLLAGLFLCLHFATWTASLSYTTVASAVFLILLQPLMAALAAHAFLAERLNRWNFIAMLLTLLGAVLIYWGDVQLGQDYIFGDLLAMIGAVLAMAYLFVARIVRPDRGEEDEGIPLHRYLPVVYWAATIGLGIICVVSGQDLGPFETSTWLGLLALGLIPTVIGHSLFNWALRYLPAFTVNIAIVGEPIGASLLAFAFFQEIPSKGLMVGGPLMILAVLLVFVFPPTLDRT